MGVRFKPEEMELSLALELVRIEQQSTKLRWRVRVDEAAKLARRPLPSRR
jgi:hypothetical protein